MLLSLLSSVAVAGVPVVFDVGEAAGVIEAVALRTGLPPGELSPVPLSDLLGAEAATLGDAVMRRCTASPASAADVRADLARAEAAWVRADRVGAADQLDLAVAHLGCLSELAESAVGARVFLLRGALEAGSDLEAAEGELRTALAFQGDLGWEAAFPAEGAAVLEGQRSALATCRIDAAPAATASGPWLDGRLLTNAPLSRIVPDGLHLAQYRSPKGIRSAWLVVGGDATLVVPTSFRRPVLESTVDAATRPALEALLAAAVPGFEVGYVTWGGGLWLVTSDEEGRATTEISPPAPLEPEPEGKKKKR